MTQFIDKTVSADFPLGRDNGDIITTKLNRNIKIQMYRDGTLGRMEASFVGDSMAGYGGGTGLGSFLAQARLLYYDADIIYRDGDYYNKQLGPDSYPPFPSGPKGMNFAAGGTVTQHMLDVQLPYIKEAFAAGTLPPLMVVSCFQNDKFFNPDQKPEDSCLRVIDFCKQVLPLGVTIIMMGVWPHSRIGGGTTTPGTQNAGKHYIEHRMKEFASVTPGLIYVPILDSLKTGNAVEETNGITNWKGWEIPSDQVGRYSADEIHAAPLGARVAAKPFAEQGLRKVVREYTPPVFDATEYSISLNKYGNFFGPLGRFAGSGGTIVNVADPVPANWTRTATNNLPAGIELVYDQSKGITLTPSLTGDPVRPLLLTPSGTATAEVRWALRIMADKEWPAGTFELYAKARWIAARNWSGIAIGNAGERAPGIPSGEVIRNLAGHGSWGSVHNIMPFELNEVLTFHTMPFYLNAGYGKLKGEITGSFMPGLAPSGALEISRFGMFLMNTSGA